MIKINKSHVKGISLIILSTILWAVNGNIGSYLFRYKGFTPEHLTMFRLIFAGLFLLIYEYHKNKSKIFNIFKDRDGLLKLFYFAFLGLLAMQYGYFAAVEHSNAATATILQYLSPFVIIIITSIWMKKLPSKDVILALFFAIIGAFLLITHGKINQLAITKYALLFGFLAAFGHTNYNLASVPLQKKYDTTLIMAWAMFLSGIGFSIFFRPWTVAIVVSTTSILGTAYVILLGTLFPFLFYLTGAKIIGVQKASILSLIEPVAATVISVLFMGENFILLDYLGIGLVVLALYLITKSENKEKVIINEPIKEESTGY